MSKVISIVCQKGGVGKTTTAVHLGIGLAREGKKVLLIDADQQSSLSANLGFNEPPEFDLSTEMNAIINETEIHMSAIKTHNENVDVLPASHGIGAMEVTLNSVDTFGREYILREYINKVKQNYDYVIIDTAPSLSIMLINTLAAADSVIIPVLPEYLAAKGVEQLLLSIVRVRKRIHKTLAIDGVLITMFDERKNDAKEVVAMIDKAYGEHAHILGKIPRSVIVPASTRLGKSLYTYAPEHKATLAYKSFVKEVI